MAFIRNNFLTGLFTLLPSLAEACPACLIADNGRFNNQTFWIAGGMWLLPILLAAAVGFQIYRLCHFRSEKNKENS